MNVARTAGILLLLSSAMAGTAARGSTTTSAYPHMAPLSEYLSADRQSEIDLARSAAPPSISGDATVLVLTAHGYQTAQKGSNGFTCLVERSWENAFDNAEFWNSKMRGPVCYNASASRSVLPYTMFRTKMALAGVAKAAMFERLKAAIASKQLPRIEPGSMAYMMSKQQYLNDGAKAWYPHVMVYAPEANGARGGASWGANLRGSPVVFDASAHEMPEPWALFFIPIGTWSDGSNAPA
jgi:hypothetical protein